MSAANVAKRAEQILHERLAEREEQKQIDQILARVPTDERCDYEGMTLAQVKRLAARFHAHALTGGVPSLPEAERADLAAKMGVTPESGHLVQEVGTRLVFNAFATAKDAERALASVADARKKGAKTNGEALVRALANNGGRL